MLPRLHLFEFEDFAWFPTNIRNYMTDYLQFLFEKTKGYNAVAPILADMLRQSGQHRIIDLCSGGSGPATVLQPELLRLMGKPVTITLTDLYPNLPAWEKARAATDGAVDYNATPVDATQVPQHLTGVRTQFTTFHHFRPADGQKILADAARSRVPILIAEATERKLLPLIMFSLTIIPMVFILTPFIRPFLWQRLLFTYLIPIVPLCTFWDGFASHWRSYHPAEMLGLANGLNIAGYEWKAGVAQHPKPARVVYLTGMPVG